MPNNHVRIGALAPLIRPGWVSAGRQLLAGLELGVRTVNDAGGIGGRPLELVVRDTAADPARAEAAVSELAGLGVAALVGEYHSVVARTAATRADALGLPYLCSSAVLDTLTERPSPWVARLPPPQSAGWRIYADFLASLGHRHVAVVTQPSVYWASGTRILRDHLDTVIELAPDTVCDRLVASGSTALLLLVGHPDPAMSIVRSVRRDRRLAGLLIGAPAGQPELPEWAALGPDGAGIPFLRYLPRQLGPLGTRVEAALGGRPSFVAFEGYDSIAVLAEALRTDPTQSDPAQSDPARSGRAWSGPVAWSGLVVEGARGPISFSRTSSVWQWTSPPVQVADRDPAAPDRFRVLHTA